MNPRFALVFPWVLIATIAGAGALRPALGQGAGDPPPAPVVVSSARLTRLAPVARYPGTVISRSKARLAAEVEGRLEWVAEVGAVVAQGEVLARIDGTLLGQQLAEDQAAVSRERARLEFLEAEVGRLHKLVQQNTATRSRLDEAVANRGVTRSEIEARGARVRITRERLERTVLRAPFPGVVVERLLEPGEWADTGAAVLRIVDTSSLEVQAWVPVQVLRYVSPGSLLELESGTRSTTGPVRTIVPVGDDRSRLYELRISLAETSWPVGQDVRVAVPTAEAREVIAVPRDALVLRRDGTTVFRVGGDSVAERVEVVTGIAEGELIEVTGIADGDRVVVRGGERLRPGQKVAAKPLGERS